MAFFNEFPHTRTYDSDLAWLIRRMKEILARMDSLEERMAALEQLVADFINSLDIEQAIKDALLEMVAQGVFDDLLNQLFNSYTATINQRLDAQDATIASLEGQINDILQNFMQSVNQRITAIENSLSNYYTKTEIDNLIKPVSNVVFDQDITWGTDINYRYGRGLQNFTVTSAHLKLVNYSSNLTRIILSVNGTGDKSVPQSNSYSPEFSFTSTLRNKIKDIFKTNDNYVVSKNPNGFWNNTFMFDENNELDGVIMVLLKQGWNPEYTSTSSGIWTDGVYYNLARA